MRCGARLDADQARRQLLEKRYDLPALQLPANNYLADSINTVHLKEERVIERRLLTQTANLQPAKAS
jgi:hypothetical protein